MTWRFFAAAAIAMILAVGVNPSAQAMPDFSGQMGGGGSPTSVGWRHKQARAVAAAGVPASSAGFGPEFTVKQDAKDADDRAWRSDKCAHIQAGRVGEQEHRDARRSATGTDRDGDVGREQASDRDAGAVPGQHAGAAPDWRWKAAISSSIRPTPDAAAARRSRWSTRRVSVRHARCHGVPAQGTRQRPIRILSLLR